MEQALSGKTALVTGATGKLSRAICLRLSAAGAQLALHYHTNRTAVEELAKAIKATGGQCRSYSFDLARADSPSALAERVLADFGKVEILVHAASAFVRRRLAETEDSTWQHLLDLHVTAAFRLVRALETNFKSRPGAIVNVADIWALKPKAAFLAYSVSKAALVALTQGLAEELAPQTTVNAVAPGIIDFPDGTPESVREAVLDRIPMHRVGSYDEVAELILEVITNRYITGQTLVIDGGRSLA
jgi:pteridine reductase